jgi:YVTN family beta-propeller protein
VGRRLDFRLLGPLEVRDGYTLVPLGARKQRAVLAILLLHANEVVSRDRLIDSLWGESPPAAAATALHGYVSQLRKALEPDRDPGSSPSLLLTRDPGYVLQLQLDQLDLERFRALLTSARKALADGQAGQASEALDAALALWRGRPLADLEDENWAQAELPPLAELRLAAVEERFEAGLALGHHHELISELEAHIAQNPLRERPRGQLMLALYRSGRQAEALRAYQDARRTLVEEVGIEPGAELRELEQRILDQDPDLALPRGRRPVRSPSRTDRLPSRNRVVGAAALGLVAVAAALTILLLALGGSGKSSRVTVVPGSVVAIDLKTNRVTAAVALGGTPTEVSVGEGAVWALDADSQTVSRIDPRTHAVRTFGTGGVPTDLAAGAGSVWVGNGRRSGAQFVGPLTTTVSSIDPNSSAIRATVELPRRAGATSNVNGNHIAVARDGVWVVNPDFTVSRLDPRDTQIRATVGGVSAVAVAAGDRGVWVLGEDDSLRRVDGSSSTAPIHLASNGLSGLAVGDGALWATAPYDGTLWRADLSPRVVERTISVGTGASAVTVGGGAVWVINALRGTVERIDPQTNAVVATIKLGGTPRSAAVGAGRLWVTVAGAASVPATKAVSGAGTLPTQICGPVFYGGTGRPDRLIVSDMPLRGGPDLPTQQMSQAIAFVLREHGFRAGPYRVGYQSCDDSTAQTGIFDPAKCAANAKVFAADRSVIGVIGPYNSSCAAEEIPLANAAPDGPLAMISPTNSDVGLTRAGPTSPEGGLHALYPTGRRNYARLYPTEAAQGAADALEAQRLGAHRVFVLSDGGYGETMAFYFTRAARKLGLRVAGVQRWNPTVAGYAQLATRVAGANPGAVFVAGLLDTNGGAVIKALRKRLPSTAHIIAGDGLLPVSSLFRSAGTAARGVLVSVAGLPPRLLGPEGRNFLRDFGATQPDATVHRHSIYAAAATATLLGAIANSNGTRPSVAKHLLADHQQRGILGPFHFDPAGDIVPSPITIVRTQHGGGASTIESTDGATIEQAIQPPARLTN